MGIFGGSKTQSTDGGMAAMMAQQNAQAQKEKDQMQAQLAAEKDRTALAAADAAKQKAAEDTAREQELSTAQNEYNAQQTAMRQNQQLGTTFDNTRSKAVQSLLARSQGLTGFGTLMGDTDNDPQKQPGYLGQGNTLVGGAATRGFNFQNTGGRKFV